MRSENSRKPKRDWEGSDGRQRNLGFPQPGVPATSLARNDSNTVDVYSVPTSSEENASFADSRAPGDASPWDEPQLPRSSTRILSDRGEDDRNSLESSLESYNDSNVARYCESSDFDSPMAAALPVADVSYYWGEPGATTTMVDTDAVHSGDEVNRSTNDVVAPGRMDYEYGSPFSMSSLRNIRHAPTSVPPVRAPDIASDILRRRTGSTAQPSSFNMGSARFNASWTGAQSPAQDSLTLSLDFAHSTGGGHRHSGPDSSDFSILSSPIDVGVGYENNDSSAYAMDDPTDSQHGLLNGRLTPASSALFNPSGLLTTVPSDQQTHNGQRTAPRSGTLADAGGLPRRELKGRGAPPKTESARAIGAQAAMSTASPRPAPEEQPTQASYDLFPYLRHGPSAPPDHALVVLPDMQGDSPSSASERESRAGRQDDKSKHAQAPPFRSLPYNNGRRLEETPRPPASDSPALTRRLRRTSTMLRGASVPQVSSTKLPAKSAGQDGLLSPSHQSTGMEVPASCSSSSPGDTVSSGVAAQTNKKWRAPNTPVKGTGVRLLRVTGKSAPAKKPIPHRQSDSERKATVVEIFERDLGLEKGELINPPQFLVLCGKEKGDQSMLGQTDAARALAATPKPVLKPQAYIDEVVTYAKPGYFGITVRPSGRDTTSPVPPPCVKAVASDRLRLAGHDLALGICATGITVTSMKSSLTWASALPAVVESALATLNGQYHPIENEQTLRTRSGVPLAYEQAVPTSSVATHVARFLVNVGVCVIKDDLWRDLLAPALSSDQTNPRRADYDSQMKQCQRMRRVEVGGSMLLGPRFKNMNEVEVRSMGELFKVVELAHQNLTTDDQKRGLVQATVSVLSWHAESSAAKRSAPTPEQNSPVVDVLCSAFISLSAVSDVMSEALQQSGLPLTAQHLKKAVRMGFNIYVLNESEEINDEASRPGTLQEFLRKYRTNAPAVGSVRALSRYMEQERSRCTRHGEIIKGRIGDFPAFARSRSAMNLKEGMREEEGMTNARNRSYLRVPQRGWQSRKRIQVSPYDRYVLYCYIRVWKAYEHSVQLYTDVIADCKRLLGCKGVSMPKVFPETKYCLEAVMEYCRTMEQKAKAVKEENERARANRARREADTRRNTAGDGDAADGGVTPGDVALTQWNAPVSPVVSEKGSLDKIIQICDEFNAEEVVIRRPGFRSKGDVRLWSRWSGAENVLVGSVSIAGNDPTLPFCGGDVVTETTFGMTARAATPAQPGAQLTESERMVLETKARLAAKEAGSLTDQGHSRPDPTLFTHPASLVLLLNPQSIATAPSRDTKLGYQAEIQNSPNQGDKTTVVFSRVKERASGAKDKRELRVTVDEVTTGVALSHAVGKAGGADGSRSPFQVLSQEDTAEPLRSTRLLSAFHSFVCGRNSFVVAVVNGRSHLTNRGDHMRRSVTVTELIPALVSYVRAQGDWELYMSVTDVIDSSVVRDHVRMAKGATSDETDAEYEPGVSATTADGEDEDEEDATDSDSDADSEFGHAMSLLPEERRCSLWYRSAWTPAGPVIEAAEYLRVVDQDQVTKVLRSAFAAVNDDEVKGEVIISFLLRRPTDQREQGDALFSSLRLLLTTSAFSVMGLEAEQTTSMDSNRNMVLGTYCSSVVLVAELADACWTSLAETMNIMTNAHEKLRYTQMTQQWSMKRYSRYLAMKARDVAHSSAEVMIAEAAERRGKGAAKRTGSAATCTSPGRSLRTQNLVIIMNRMIGIANELANASFTAPKRACASWAGHPLALTVEDCIYDVVMPYPQEAIRYMREHDLAVEIDSEGKEEGRHSPSIARALYPREAEEFLRREMQSVARDHLLAARLRDKVAPSHSAIARQGPKDGASTPHKPQSAIGASTPAPAKAPLPPADPRRMLPSTPVRVENKGVDPREASAFSNVGKNASTLMKGMVMRDLTRGGLDAGTALPPVSPIASRTMTGAGTRSTPLGPTGTFPSSSQPPQRAAGKPHPREKR